MIPFLPFGLSFLVPQACPRNPVFIWLWYMPLGLDIHDFYSWHGGFALQTPASAVEMPGSADVTGLNVQFGALEFGSESSLSEFGSAASSENSNQIPISLYSKSLRYITPHFPGFDWSKSFVSKVNRAYEIIWWRQTIHPIVVGLCSHHQYLIRGFPFIILKSNPVPINSYSQFPFPSSPGNQ